MPSLNSKEVTIGEETKSIREFALDGKAFSSDLKDFILDELQIADYIQITNSDKQADNKIQQIVAREYSFKSAKIEQRINEIRTLLSAEDAPNDEEMNDLVAEQILLEKIKLVFSEKLGRIILR
jgi:hypothetical protein